MTTRFLTRLQSVTDYLVIISKIVISSDSEKSSAGAWLISIQYNTQRREDAKFVFVFAPMRFFALAIAADTGHVANACAV